MSGWPFHAGELEAQRRAGGGSSGGGIRDLMTGQHRAFFEALPFVVVAGRLGGWPVATILAGAPGFVAAPDARTLRVGAAPHPSDPAARALVEGAPAGLLGIEFPTRRRNRANGQVRSAGTAGLELEIRQSFGNCTQHLDPSPLRDPAAGGGPVEPLGALDPEAREQIARTTTCFVASGADAGEPAGGLDVSHRGGPAGFLRLAGDTITIPDFAGNRFFNTLGNLCLEPRASLLLVDRARGGLLHLQGTSELVWDGPEVRATEGAERLWRLHVRCGWRRRGAGVPVREE